MPIRRSLLRPTLALGLALSACNHPENGLSTAVPGPEAGDSARARTFEREALAIKARHQDPKRIEAELRSLIARLGHPQSPAAGGAPVQPPLRASADPLAKTAGVSTLFNAKSANLFYYFANTLVFSIPHGTTLTASTKMVGAGLDPMLVGFYKNEASVHANAYRTKIVGYVDDNGPNDLNASFTWTNNTNATQSVRVVLFGYPGSSGKGTLNTMLSKPGALPILNTKTRWVSANPVLDNFQGPPGEWDCEGPFLTRIRFKKTVTANIGSTVIAINAGTLRGGYIKETDTELALRDVLPSGNYNAMLTYIEGGSKPQPDPIDSEDLWEYYGGNTWRAYQYDRYDCESPDL